MKILRVLSVSPLLILAACTLSTAQKETVNLTLHLNAPHRVGPGTIAGFDCLAINVVGEGIPSSDPTDTDTDMISILDGNDCTYPGTTSPLLTNGSSITTSLKVKRGKSRVVQVLGIESKVGCPSTQDFGAFLARARRFDGTLPGYNQIYELGRATIDLEGSATVAITPTYDPEIAKSIRFCNGRFNIDPRLASPNQDPRIWLRADHYFKQADNLELGSVAGTEWKNEVTAANGGAIDYLAHASVGVRFFEALAPKGNPALQFLAGSNSHRISPGFDPIQGVSIFILAKRSTANIGPLICITGGSDCTSPSVDYIAISAGSPGEIRLTTNEFNVSTASTSATTFGANEYALYQAKWTYGSQLELKIYTADTTESNTVGTASGALNTNGYIFVGTGSGSNTFEGEIAEVLVYNEDAPVIDENVVLDYFGYRYGIFGSRSK